MATIEFFFDVASAYTYLAATQVDAAAAEAGVEVEWRPFLLGGVFKSVGNSMPAAIAPKAAFMLADLNRWAVDYDVPFEFPETFPINSIAPQRALTALYKSDRDLMKQLAHELLNRYWVEGKDVSQPDELLAAAEAVGADTDELGAAIADQEVKDALRDLTAEAVKRGAFGAPTFFVGDEIFFGNDRLAHAIRAAKQ
jgi:2-hydroxychromene-2-carboxylate isomerase